MIYILVNALPILLAALGGTAVFAVAWRRRGGVVLLGAVFAASLVLSAILAGALILAPVKAGGWTVALGSAFIIWGGFVFPSVTTTVRAHGVRWSAALGDAAIWLAAMMIEAAVMHLVRVVHP